MFATLSTAWVLPGVIGPAVAGVVGEFFGWRYVFLGLLPLIAAAGLLTIRAAGRRPATGPRRPPRPRPRRPSAAGSPTPCSWRLGAGLITRRPDAGRGAVPTVGLVLVGLVLAAPARSAA